VGPDLGSALRSQPTPAGWAARLRPHVLSLELLELFDPEERDIVTLITEQDDTKVAP
jgi:hypothetical protein